MKCPNCGFNSFDNIEECNKCGAVLGAGAMGLAEKGLSFFKSRHKAYKSEVASHGLDAFIRSDETTGDFEKVSPLKDKKVEESDSGHDVDRSGYTSSVLSDSAFEDLDREEISLILAPLDKRVKAFLIDLLIILSISLLTIVSGLLTVGNGVLSGIVNLSYIFIPVYLILTLLISTYMLFLHGFYGKTLGKMLMGISVIGENGKRIDLSASFIRWVGLFISAVPFSYGFISAYFDKNLQAWHDKLSKTYVIRN